MHSDPGIENVYWKQINRQDRNRKCDSNLLLKRSLSQPAFNSFRCFSKQCQRPRLLVLKLSNPISPKAQNPKPQVGVRLRGATSSSMSGMAHSYTRHPYTLYSSTPQRYGRSPLNQLSPYLNPQPQIAENLLVPLGACTHLVAHLELEKRPLALDCAHVESVPVKRVGRI